MVVVKHKYIPGRNRGGNVVSIGKALAHVRYIQHRPGPDKERGGRELFDENGDRIDAKEMRKAIREAGNVTLHDKCDMFLQHKCSLHDICTPSICMVQAA